MKLLSQSVEAFYPKDSEDGEVLGWERPLHLEGLRSSSCTESMAGSGGPEITFACFFSHWDHPGIAQTQKSQCFKLFRAAFKIS